MADKGSMVQRIGGKDSPSTDATAAQDSKRQDDRNAVDRGAKFQSMLGQTGRREAEAARRPAGEASSKPGASASTARPGPDAGTDAAGAAGPGRTGPGSRSEVAAAAKDLQSALEEMGMKTSQKGATKGGGEEASGEGGAFAAQLASGAGATPSWARPEGPARLESPGRMLPAELEGVDKMHRLLIGQGPGGAEARLAITSGPLAGAEIHLRTGPGGVQAAVSTNAASARETLVTAMEEVARRLKDKGHRLTVRMSPPPTRPEHNRWPPDPEG